VQEMSKATKRRYQDPAYHLSFFRGHGLDIGAGDDPLARWVGQFARLESVRSWDVKDGDATMLAGVPDGSYDFVVSSHCLEHLYNYMESLWNWSRVLKPGGYLIVTVPDEDLYEGGVFPSAWNGDHKHTFTVHKPTGGPRKSWSPRSVNLLPILEKMSEWITVERLQLVRDFWQPALAGTDQTLNPNTESCIEFVLRKHG
jgi:SAM-dependent methyltransferase